MDRSNAVNINSNHNPAGAFITLEPANLQNHTDHHQLERILQSTSLTLLNAYTLESASYAALEHIRSALNISRIYIGKNVHKKDGAISLKRITECCDYDIEPVAESTNWQKLTDAGTSFQSWRRILADEKPYCAQLNELTEPEQYCFSRLQIQSFALIPIFVDGIWWGVLGLEECRFRRIWNTEVLDFLVKTANLISAKLSGEHQVSLAIKRAKRKHFQGLSQATDSILYERGINGEQIWCSENVVDVLGYNARSVHQEAAWWLANIHPSDWQNVSNSLLECVQKNQPVWSMQYRFRHGNGDYINILDRAYINYGPEGMIKITGSIQKSTTPFAENNSTTRQVETSLHIPEEERKALSRELHDHLSQALTTIKLDLDWLTRKLPAVTDNMNTCMQGMSKTISDTMLYVRELALQMRQPAKPEFSLQDAVKQQLAKFHQRAECQCSTSIEKTNLNLDADTEAHLFQIFQETLTNIIRHSSASKIFVRLECENNNLVMQIRDNGTGIPLEKLNSEDSVGLIGMHERARLIGAKIQILSPPEEGTSITVKMPLP